MRSSAVQEKESAQRALSGVCGEAACTWTVSPYQTRQLLTGIIGWPALQPKASPISGIF
jgi:hypothetical protein